MSSVKLEHAASLTVSAVLDWRNASCDRAIDGTACRHDVKAKRWAGIAARAEGLCNELGPYLSNTHAPGVCYARRSNASASHRSDILQLRHSPIGGSPRRGNMFTVHSLRYCVECGARVAICLPPATSVLACTGIEPDTAEPRKCTPSFGALGAHMDLRLQRHGILGVTLSRGKTGRRTVAKL